MMPSNLPPGCTQDDIDRHLDGDDYCDDCDRELRRCRCDDDPDIDRDIDDRDIDEMQNAYERHLFKEN